MEFDRRTLLVVGCCLLLALAGCAGGGDGNAPAANGDDAGTVEPTPGESADTTGDSGSVAGAAVENRALIRTGEATVVVDSFAAARAAAVTAARERGGFVGASDQRVHTAGNQSWTTGTLVLRVPSGNFSGFLETVRDLGEVRSVETETEDVTDRLVDLNARIENLVGQRDQLRELYNRTNETDELLRIQERLSEVQTEIERLSAQRKSLRDRVAYSTLTLHVEEEPPTATVATERWYDTPLVGAFLQSVEGVALTLRKLGVLGAYAAPYLLVFGTPVVGVGWWLRRRNEEVRVALGAATEDSTDDDALETGGNDAERGGDVGEGDEES